MQSYYLRELELVYRSRKHERPLYLQQQLEALHETHEARIRGETAFGEEVVQFLAMAAGAIRGVAAPRSTCQGTKTTIRKP